MGFAPITIILLLCAFPARAADKWTPVPPVDWSRIKLGDFRDDELDLPHYLHHFHTVANAVIEDGPNRGFMGEAVWRGRDKNQQGPWNARVMESHLSLAFFFCTNRPWNPYFASPAVRQRLEAMLTFWCNMQNEDGRFSEYGPQQWNLPSTAFATKFIGQTLTLLHEHQKDCPLDPALLKRVISSDRKAIIATLTMPDLYEHGKKFTNQYCNVFAGAAAYLALFPDPEIQRLLEQKVTETSKDFLSPCGYFYEADGPDFGYTLHTTHSDVEMCFHYFGAETSIGKQLLDVQRKWYDWLSFNLLRQPDGSTFVINRGIETRQKHADWSRQDGAIVEHVELACAFATMREELKQNNHDQRQRLKENWGKFGEVTAGTGQTSFSPYTFLHRTHTPFYPTAQQRDAAIAKLPYLARDRFVRQMSDTRKNALFTFIRRPRYYTIFNAGEQITPQQRRGLGLIWSPRAGTVMQTQTDSADDAWGTRADGAEQVYEAGDVATSLVDDTFVYSLGNVGRKTIIFNDDDIEVRIEHAGKFTEQIPLIITPDAPRVLTVDSPVKSQQKQGGIVFGKSRIETTTLSATDSLTYHLRIAP